MGANEGTGNWWTCSKCGYILQATAPPEVCASCGENCIFVDATCYTPECGGADNIDPRIVQRAEFQGRSGAS
jgi:rubredoxin